MRKASEGKQRAAVIWITAALAALSFIGGAGPTHGAGSPSAAALQQIADIEALKQGFSDAEKKMPSNLVLVRRHALGHLAGQFARLVNRKRVDSRQMIQVDIKGEVTESLLRRIASIGGTVDNQVAAYRHVRATVPVTMVESIAQLPEVTAVREADQPVTNAGALTSQGYVSHTAKKVVEELHIDGSGVKVGVLSDSASPARVAALKASDDLPQDVTVLPGQDGGNLKDEGCAMMEIVHDLAPGAKLFFATAVGGEGVMAANIAALAAAGCTIIVDDITYPLEGAFQDGPIAQAVNAFAAGGGLYFSSAANSGNLTKGTSGTWEGDFLDGGTADAALALQDTGSFHNFGTAASPLLFDTLTAESDLITLQWSDPLGASGNDYDLFIFDAAGTTVKGVSMNTQTGIQNPFEWIARGANCGTPSATGYCPAVGDRIYVVKHRGVPLALRLDTHRGRLSRATAGSTYGHNAGQGTITVAATYWNSAKTGTKPFTGFANTVETFSSDGPRKMFFNPDGTAITAGNLLFGSNGGTTLSKPDLTAADGVSCKTPGFLPFYGTSAAAPHAAAVAALVKQAKPALSSAQLRQLLFGSALDTMAVGIDRNSGHGIIMAVPAIDAPPPP